MAHSGPSAVESRWLRLYGYSRTGARCCLWTRLTELPDLWQRVATLVTLSVWRLQALSSAYSQGGVKPNARTLDSSSFRSRLGARAPLFPGFSNPLAWAVARARSGEPAISAPI